MLLYLNVLDKTHYWPAGPCLFIYQISMNVQSTLVIMEVVKMRSMVIIVIVNLVILELAVIQVWKESHRYKEIERGQSGFACQRPYLHLYVCRRLCNKVVDSAF